jgi:hypothetical protein
MAAVKLEVVPAGAFSTAYDVLVDGLPKGRIEHRVLSLRDEAVVTTPDRSFTARRERVFRAGAVLESAGGTLRATAEREQVWREHYRVRFGDTTLFLRQKAWSLKGVFLISDGTGEIGSIRRERMMSRRMVVELPNAAPPPLEIIEFLVWIVLMVQRRQSSESSG